MMTFSQTLVNETIDKHLIMIEKKNKISPQHTRILEQLNKGVVLTSLSALQSCGVYALSQRVGELIGKGYKIRRTPIKRTNRFGESVRITAYDIASEDRES